MKGPAKSVMQPGTITRATILLSLLFVAGTLLIARPLRAAPAKPTTRVIELDAQQFAYSPGILEVNRGDRVIIKLRSRDVTHGFYLDGYELETKTSPAAPGRLEFVADRPGRYMFRCSVTCGPFHPYMTGWLRVRPNNFWNASLGLTALIAVGSLALIWTKGGQRHVS